MKQAIANISLLIKDYDEAITFFTQKLDFVLLEDVLIPDQAKRWVIVAPKGAHETRISLARASTPEQEARIGSQTGGRVFLSLQTDDFWRDYNDMVANDIQFVREPKEEPYGMVAVFADLYGNLWDLISYK